jgi:carbon monoxide dehydrogenase subunit G
MSNVTHSIEINRPVEQVFAYLDNPDNLKDWLSGLVEATMLTHDGPGVGAKMRQVFEEGGRRIEMIEETVVYEPNRRVKIKGTTAMFDMTADYTLHNIGGRTRLDFAEEMHFKSIFLRLLAPLMAKSARKKMVEDFARLKANIEAL